MADQDTTDFGALRKAARGKPKHKKPGRPLNPRNRIVYIEDLEASGYGSRATIWRMVANGTLPRPFKYGVKAAWREATIAKRLDRHQQVPTTA